MSRIGLAILGTGRIAADYFGVLDGLADFALVGVADRRAAVATAAGERWSCPHFASVERLLDEVRPDAVVVAVPPAWHEEVSLQALAAGAHVLSEKPLALDLEAGRRMLAAAERHRRVLTMSAKFRHVPDVIEAKVRLESGLLGRLVFAENAFASPVAMAERWNSDPAVSGGGVLVDNGTHSVDLLRYLVGPVTWVEARRGRSLQQLRVEDSVRLQLGHASGLLSSVVLSWSVSLHDPWYLRIHGEEGSLMLGWNQSHVHRRGESEPRPFGCGYSKATALSRQLRHFAALIRDEEAPLLDADDLLASIAVVAAANRSLAAEGAVEHL